MKMRINAACFVAAAAIILAGCYHSENHARGLGLLALMSPEDLVADMSQSSLESLNEGMTDINNSGVTSLSYRIQYPGTWQEHPTLLERLAVAENIMMGPFSANAETVSCPGGGSVEVTDPAGTWNSGNGSFYVTRSFNSCTGPFGLFRVSGDAVLYWTGLNAAKTGAAKLQAGSKLEQAPVNKRFTRVATGGYVTVEGNGGTLTSGSLSGAIAHTVEWITVGATLTHLSADKRPEPPGIQSGRLSHFRAPYHDAVTPRYNRRHEQQHLDRVRYNPG